MSIVCQQEITSPVNRTVEQSDRNNRILAIIAATIDLACKRGMDRSILTPRLYGVWTTTVNGQMIVTV